MDNTIEIRPSGVKSLDSALNGGLPGGSFVLLSNEAGAGAHHFVYTAIQMLSSMKEEQRVKNKAYNLPEKICYISFTRPKDHIFNELFGVKLASVESVNKYMTFIDLSDKSFLNSKVPRSWISNDTALPLAEKAPCGLTIRDGGMSPCGDCNNPCGSNKSLVDTFIAIVDKHANNNLIIIDSLTDLIRCFPCDCEGWKSIIWLLKGMEHVAKVRNCTIYAIMPLDTIERIKQEEVMECANNVFIFSWDYKQSPPRRMLYIRKISGFMPFAEYDRMPTFETLMTVNGGFQVANIKEIIGKN